MLFNSYVFILVFMPVTLIGFYLCARIHFRAAVASLVLASLIYYGWWSPPYLLLILFSIFFNFRMGVALADAGRAARVRKGFLIAGVAINLALLGYFKYANFFTDSLNAAFDLSIHMEKIVLPLAISFFTFQQIAFLVDAHRGLTREYSFLDYCLFVTFFPQLIAGPIVHHAEMLPQFADRETYRPSADNLSVGLIIFAAGLFKKVVIADGVSQTANDVFGVAASGADPLFVDAWAGALAYTFQIYFDFSGYSDMAVGLGRMFGIRIPVNFDSPYKATSIIEFWRRWHITLSRFLRDYLYIPLGGNRRGKARRYVNLMVTMLLGGLWHGAAWTFMFWGGLHGLYLVLNHGLSVVFRKVTPNEPVAAMVFRFAAWGLTFLGVIVGWVFFRADSFDAAWRMLTSMSGVSGISLDRVYLSLAKAEAIAMAGVIALLAPNTNEMMQRLHVPIGWKPRPPETFPRIATKFLWRRSVMHAIIAGVVLAVALIYVSRAHEFLYYQF